MSSRPSFSALAAAAVVGAFGMWAWQHGAVLTSPDGPAAALVADAQDWPGPGPVLARLIPRPAPEPTPPGVSVVPLRRQKGGFLAPVTVDGVLSADFVLDSGASEVVLTTGLARELMRQGQLGPGDYLGQGYAVLADGSQVPERMVMLRTLKVGGRELHNVPAAIAQGRGQPLLGQSFLRRFRRWSVDNRRRELRLEG